jgi:hypothetical protein
MNKDKRNFIIWIIILVISIYLTAFLFTLPAIWYVLATTFISIFWDIAVIVLCAIYLVGWIED